MSVVYSLVYQILLWNGLDHWIQHASRDDNLFNANKEGVSSLIGYVAIHLFGAAFGHRLFDGNGVGRGAGVASWMASVVGAAWMCYGVGVSLFQLEISRRSVNGMYVVATVAFNVSVILAHYLLLHHLQTPPTPSALLLAVSKRQFLVFLFANVMTGMVNFMMYTLFASNLVSLIVIVLYLFGVSLFAVMLHVWCK